MEHVSSSTGKVAVELLLLLGPDTTQTHVSILKDLDQEPRSNPLHDIPLGLVKSVYVRGGFVRELKHKGCSSMCITDFLCTRSDSG